MSPTSTPAPEPAIGPWFFCLRHPAEAQCIRIVIIGELRLATASRVRSVIRRAQDDAGEVICDLGDVFSVDAFGAYVLVDAAARARHNGVRRPSSTALRLSAGSSRGSGSRTPSGRTSRCRPREACRLTSGQRSTALATHRAS